MSTTPCARVCGLAGDRCFLACLTREARSPYITHRYLRNRDIDILRFLKTLVAMQYDEQMLEARFINNASEPNLPHHADEN